MVGRAGVLTRREALLITLGAIGVGAAGLPLAGCSPSTPAQPEWQRRLTTGTQGDPVRIGFLGDSITFGAAASGNSPPKYRWCYPGQLREMLRPVYGDAGTGWVLMNQALWPVTAANSGWDPRLTFSGPIRKVPAGPFKLSCAEIPPSIGAPSAYVEFKAAGSTLSTITLARSGGAGRQLISVDGAQPITAEPRTVAGEHHLWTDVPLGSPGGHTVRISASGAPCDLVALRMSTGTGLIDLDVLAVSGQSLNSFCGPGNDDERTGRYGLPFVDTFGVDLLVVALGTNDYNEGRPLDQVQSLLTKVIDRQRGTKGEVALLFPPISSPRLYPGSGAPTYTDYENLYATVAAAAGVPFLDLTHLWGADFAASDAVQPPKYADHAIHPSDDGAHDIAAACRTFLGL